MSDFVRADSIVRRIWEDGDVILLVFAGAAAEFALNRAVDWLFFTGKLPRDPIGRLFATAGYAQHIVFADAVTASCTLERIRAIHLAVECRRGESIPDWAHRDVLYMLVHYSEKAYGLLHRELNAEEQEELYDVFRRVGVGLGIPSLPPSYSGWTVDRHRHLRADLAHGKGTDALLEAYRQHLGGWRYRLLRRVQGVLVPEHVRDLLNLEESRWPRIAVKGYLQLGRFGLRPLIQRMLMPAQHLAAVRALDRRAPNVIASRPRNVAATGRASSSTR